MSYRDDVEAMQSQVQQLEGQLHHVRRERARLELVAGEEPGLVAELDRLRRALHARAPRHLPLLDDVRVASPCHERWDGMTGDAQVRHCARCDKNVYNLSAMTREAAEALLRENEGALCVRYFRRTDGTILTADCPVGVRRKRVRLVAAAGAMTALAAGAAAMFSRMGAPMPPHARSSQGAVATSPIVNAPPPPPPVIDGRGELTEMMGDVAFDPAPPQQVAPAPRPRTSRQAIRR
jgi:hypothetical protein